MTDNNPITPPPELLEQLKKSSGTWLAAITNAYQAGADQQLAEDAKWLDQYALDAPHLKITPVGESLKETMRPQPPSLKEQALAAIMNAAICGHLRLQDEEIIRRALEALPND